MPSSEPIHYMGGFHFFGSETVNRGGAALCYGRGTNTTPVLSLGYYPSGVGSYSLSGAGVLRVTTSECIGYSGTGSLAQGRTRTAQLLYLGYDAGSVGSYNLIAGSVVTSGPVIVGNSGYGTFTQVAGSNTNHGILLAAASTMAPTTSAVRGSQLIG